MEIKKFTPKDHFVKAVIYGASGAGKTFFSSTAPNPIYASAEGWLLSIAHMSPDFVEIKTLKDLQDLYSYLKKGGHWYETVIIDSITEISDGIKAEIEKTNNRQLELKDWWELGRKMESILRTFRDLPMHVLFITQENVEKDEDRVIKIVPSLNGKLQTKIAYFMDIVGYILIDKEGVRHVITESSEKLLTKDRSGLIGNSTNADFGQWIDIVKWIEVGEQQVVATHKREETTLEQPKKKTPPPVAPAQSAASEEEKPKNSMQKMAEESIRKETANKMFAVWNEMRDMLMKKKPNEVEENGDKKYTAKKKDAARKATILQKFGLDSSTKLSELQARQFISLIEKKIGELKLEDDHFGEEWMTEEEKNSETPETETPLEEAGFEVERIDKDTIKTTGSKVKKQSSTEDLIDEVVQKKNKEVARKKPVSKKK